MNAPLQTTNSNDLSSCLASGRYVDSEHPAVIAFARRVAGTAMTPREIAVKLYYAVRDEFLYDPYHFDTSIDGLKASHVIAAGRGFCVPKAALLAAAARELHRHPAVAGVVVGRAVPDAARYGALTLGPGAELRGFAEKQPGPGVINAGIYLLRDTLVRQLPGQWPLSFEQEVFPRLVAQGCALKVCVVEAPFLDIGTPESLRQAEAFVQQNRAQFGD